MPVSLSFLAYPVNRISPIQIRSRSFLEEKPFGAFLFKLNLHAIILDVHIIT